MERFSGNTSKAFQGTTYHQWQLFTKLGKSGNYQRQKEKEEKSCNKTST